MFNYVVQLIVILTLIFHWIFAFFYLDDCSKDAEEKVVDNEDNISTKCEESSLDISSKTEDTIQNGNQIKPSQEIGDEVENEELPDGDINEGVKKSAIVQKILDLIGEMESSNCTEHGGLQKFHPCPLCSGKLITV